MPDHFERPDLKGALLELLDRCSFGALIVSAECRVLSANVWAREQLAAHRWILDDAAFRRAVLDAAQACIESAPTLTQPRAVGLQALVLPLEAGWPASRRRLAGVFLFDGRRDPRPDPVLLRRLYGLTAAESGLASALVEGASVAEAARTRRISIHTARHHLRRVFDKTGTRRQSQLMRVLLSGPACLLPSSEPRLMSREWPK